MLNSERMENKRIALHQLQHAGTLQDLSELKQQLYFLIEIKGAWRLRDELMQLWYGNSKTFLVCIWFPTEFFM